jgi:hypothetical protein
MPLPALRLSESPGLADGTYLGTCFVRPVPEGVFPRKPPVEVGDWPVAAYLPTGACGILTCPGLDQFGVWGDSEMPLSEEVVG